MSASQSNVHMAKFLETWAGSFSHVLSQIGLASPKVAILQEEGATEVLQQMGAQTHWVRFTGGGRLRGELALAISRPEALQLGQALMSEPADRNLEFDDTHRDAFAELVRQVAGQVTTQWKAEAGGDVELVFAEGQAASGKSATSRGLRISGENFPDVTLVFLLHAELEASLQPQPAAKSGPPEEVPASTSSEVALREAAGAGANTNLDMFLDVQLEASIRFGQRQLLLRDVLSMTPGAVVELDRQINEPAELLVAGRLVARGEVVIVDGNFGIRVTELSSPRQRVELLQA